MICQGGKRVDGVERVHKVSKVHKLESMRSFTVILPALPLFRLRRAGSTTFPASGIFDKGGVVMSFCVNLLFLPACLPLWGRSLGAGTAFWPLSLFFLLLLVLPYFFLCVFVSLWQLPNFALFSKYRKTATAANAY